MLVSPGATLQFSVQGERILVRSRNFSGGVEVEWDDVHVDTVRQAQLWIEELQEAVAAASAVASKNLEKRISDAMNAVRSAENTLEALLSEQRRLSDAAPRGRDV